MLGKTLSRGLMIVVAGVTCSLCGCNQTDSAQDRPRVAAGVAMQDVRFRSAALKREMPYRVFLPEKLPAGQKLPVVYLLHGRGQNFQDWSIHSDISRYALQGLILVMPEGNSSFYLNAALRPQDRYEDYITRDLVMDVEARFPAKTGRGNRAIVGISMGGFGAVKLALSHPELYAFAAGLSSAIDVPERQFALGHARQWWLFRSIFGPMGSAERAARDPFSMVLHADPKAAPYLYLTVGEQEPLLEPNQRFAELLKKQGFAFEFHTMPGLHDWTQWAAQIPGCFEGLLRELRKA